VTTSQPVIETRAPATISAAELYPLLRLRVDVFVVEQECPYPELDGRDLLDDTLHVWAHEDGVLLGGIRVLRAGSARPAIGRVVTAPAARGRGVAGLLLREGIALCLSAARRSAAGAVGSADVPAAGDPVAIELHAQAHLEQWYARSGFARDGEPYLEDDIPHVPMVQVLPAR
jgi:ElaA protein